MANVPPPTTPTLPILSGCFQGGEKEEMASNNSA